MLIFRKILKITTVLLSAFVLSSCAGFNTPEFAKDTLRFLSAEEKELIALNAEVEYVPNSVNLQGYYPSKVCYIEKTDTLFYSDNENLYQLTEGKTITLFNTEAAALNVADGNLFFIAVDDGNGSSLYGSVYRFNLKEQKLQKILNEQVLGISVYSGNIFYFVLETEEASEKIVCYRCDYNGKNIEELDGFAFNQENGILPVFFRNGEDKGIYLENTVSGEKSFLTDDVDLYERTLAFCGDYIYALANADTPVSDNPNMLVTNSRIKKINTADGSVTEIPFGINLYIADYTVCDDILYAYDNMYNTILKVTPDGTKLGYSAAGSGYSVYRAIYSCGGEVYAMKTNNKLYRLSFLEEDGKRIVAEELLEP